MAGVSDFNDRDLTTFIDAFIKEYTFNNHHLHSFNNFMDSGIHQIITTLFTVEKEIEVQRKDDPNMSKIYFKLTFDKINIKSPTIPPNDCRQKDTTYLGELILEKGSITAIAFYKDGSQTERKATIDNLRIASIPIMIGSNKCLLNIEKVPKEIRFKAKEDPNDEGGYFIVTGNEWVISNMESRKFNTPHIFYNKGFEKEITRLEFLSKPGDAYENSSELKIRLLKNGEIYLEFTSNPYLNLLHLPFYVLFRLLGMVTDKEVVDNIVYTYDNNPISNRILEQLKVAFEVSDPTFTVLRIETDQNTILTHMASLIAQATKAVSQEINEKSMKNNLLRLFDKNLFPHIGLGEEKRHEKLRYLALMIRKLLLVEMQVVKSTDRDSLAGKRILPAGQSLAKTIKTQFNTIVVNSIKKKITNAFETSSFAQINLEQIFRNSITSGSELADAICKAITTGNDEITVKTQTVPNRMLSEPLIRKNETNYLNTLRVIRVSTGKAAKQTERAQKMREVQPSFMGYICPVQSADTGEQVGMVKQMAVTSLISEASISRVLRDIVLNDKDLIRLNTIFPKDLTNLTNITINGYWMGGCENPFTFIKKYREFRRGYKLENGKFVKNDRNMTPLIDPKTTIYWDNSNKEIEFLTDAGRLLRPILIVRNNDLDEIGQEILGSKYDHINDPQYPKKGHFHQDIILTKKHIEDLRNNKINISDLCRMGILDYIAPEEMENCFIAPSLGDLRRNMYNSLYTYTHCEIPQVILGILALTCPNAQNNQLPRITFQTNQGKQGGGIYCLAWESRWDKHAFLQYYFEIPLVGTIISKHLYPNSLNVVVAIRSAGGNNQEDSLYCNKAASERGAYKGKAYNNLKTTLGDKEKFAIPNEATTQNIRSNSNYSNISGYCAKVGSTLHKNDVVICKVYENLKATDTKENKDISILYVQDEPGVVERVEDGTNAKGERFAKVKYSHERPMGIGSKFSSRHGQKGVVGSNLSQADLPFTEDGICPTLIMNPHAIPSRMTIGQLIESLKAKLAACDGEIVDATIFNSTDIDATRAELEKRGYDGYGGEILYDGRTGEKTEINIFISPCTYQRLQKFVTDEIYSISSGPTCSTTKQPLEGKANKGGLRIGEMEKDVIISHGAARFVMEKFRDDSDGYDIYVCNTCGTMPIVNENRGVQKHLIKCTKCNILKQIPDIYKIRSTWCTKLFLQEVMSSHVGIEIHTKPHIF